MKKYMIQRKQNEQWVEHYQHIVRDCDQDSLDRELSRLKESFPDIEYRSIEITKQMEQDQAWEYIKEYFEADQPLELHCFFKHVSRSGMMRVWSVYVIKDNQLIQIGFNLAAALGYTWNKKHNGIQFNGCGYSGPCDLAYAVSYKLGHKSCTIKYHEHF